MTEFWLELWDERGAEFDRRANTPAMQAHLGGVETGESIEDRHKRILAMNDDHTGAMFLIMVPGAAEPAGSVGYWDKQWGDGEVYELGWKVLPEFQGRGLAVAATAEALRRAAADGRHRWAHAYPKNTNGPSNALCRKAGFELIGPCDFEYPKGTPIVCNDWRYDLSALGENH